MVTELRKFKTETYILAQIEGQLIHLQLWEQGYPKVVPIFFTKRSVLSCKEFQNIWSNFCAQCCIAKERHFRMKMFMTSVIKDSLDHGAGEVFA